MSARVPLDEDELDAAEGERRALLRVRSTAEQRRERNLGKRVKLQSKRMRQLWPQVAAFLALRDVVALGSACRRLQRLLEGDAVWWGPAVGRADEAQADQECEHAGKARLIGCGARR